MDADSPLAVAKAKCSIPELWMLRGWPGKPGRSCRVPYREDRAPSGSVLADGRLFHDFASGENFDAPGLLARVEDLTPEAACRLFIDLAGTRDVGVSASLSPPRQSPQGDAERRGLCAARRRVGPSEQPMPRVQCE